MAVFSNTLGNVDFNDTPAALKKMANHIRQMQEELEYKLGNLDSENFNETGLSEITSPLTAQIGDVEGQVTELKLDMNGLSIVVQNGDESSVLLLKSGSVILSSGTIQLSGMVTFSDLAGSGTTTINGSNITTGTISADRVSGGTLQGAVIRSDREGMGGGYLTIMNSSIYLEGQNGNTMMIEWSYEDGKMYIRAGDVLGIKSGGNMAITAGEGASDIYLSCAHLYLNGTELGA
ncbi:MAG: hypothetical protein VB058_05750 [Oscillospiraceae bacterium]|nr:hypothetical protein [Oscillospiraceae bacterium]